MYPHRIRLRGPWDATPIGQPTRRTLFPCPAPGYSGRTTFERRFGYPGRIDAHERVWLVGVGVRGPAEVALQGESLGVADGRFAWDVTARLAERNRLTVSLEGQADCPPWEDIALEIRATAYFDSVEWTDSEVRGRVAGTCDGPLEVYLLASEDSGGYCRTMPGENFSLPIPKSVGPCRVELVHVSTIWDVVERPNRERASKIS